MVTWLGTKWRVIHNIYISSAGGITVTYQTAKTTELKIAKACPPIPRDYHPCNAQMFRRVELPHSLPTPEQNM